MKYSTSCLLLLLLGTLLPAGAQEDAGDEDFAKAKAKSLQRMRELQAKPEAFQPVAVPGVGRPVNFDVELGTSIVTTSEGEIYDGFRFTAPEGLQGHDYVWYFNAPETWSSWYILPVDDPDLEKRGFRNFYQAGGQPPYAEVDAPGVRGRYRTLQSLTGSFFTPGKEYLIWFKRADEAPGEVKPARLTGRLEFAPKRDDWPPKEIRAALGLKPAPPEQLVKMLGSRGGGILLDKAFFERDYADERIDAVVDAMQITQRSRGGYFITMESTCPPCGTEPGVEGIIKKFGAPDFVVTSQEAAKYSARSEADASKEPGTVTYWYDYFGFEVLQDDPEKKVIGVRAQVEDYARLNPGGAENTFGRLGMKNVTVFRQGGKEVGRMYYFLEGATQPTVLQLPPPGTYHDGENTLEHLGGGTWKLSLNYANGKPQRTYELSGNRLDGRSEAFFPNGKLEYTLMYKDGELNGPGVKYKENGEIEEKLHFKDGEPLPEPAAPQS